MAGVSLSKQQELLDAQSIALNGLHSLSKVQSEALEESRYIILWIWNEFRTCLNFSHFLLDLQE